MNCLKKNCRNQKICKIYTQIKELQGVIFGLNFDCEFFTELRNRRLDSQEYQQDFSDRIKAIEKREELLNPSKSESIAKSTVYIKTCTKCGRPLMQLDIGEIEEEYDLDTDSTKEIILCKDCASKKE
jgi:hypothetical protein